MLPIFREGQQNLDKLFEQHFQPPNNKSKTGQGQSTIFLILAWRPDKHKNWGLFRSQFGPLFRAPWFFKVFKFHIFYFILSCINLVCKPAWTRISKFQSKINILLFYVGNSGFFKIYVAVGSLRPLYTHAWSKISPIFRQFFYLREDNFGLNL